MTLWFIGSLVIGLGKTTHQFLHFAGIILLSYFPVYIIFIFANLLLEIFIKKIKKC